MTQLQDSLVQLEAQWRRHRLPIVDALQPGMNPSDVRRQLRDVGLETPGEVVEWFTWHNGAIPEGRMTPLHDMLSLENALEVHMMTLESSDLRPDEEALLLPIAHYLDGRALVVDLSGRSDDFAPVAMRTRELEVVPRADFLPSLATLVGWWVNLFATDHWYRHPKYPRVVETSMSDEEKTAYPVAAVQWQYII